MSGIWQESRINQVNFPMARAEDVGNYSIIRNTYLIEQHPALAWLLDVVILSATAPEDDRNHSSSRQTVFLPTKQYI